MRSAKQLRQLCVTFAENYQMHEDQRVKLGLDNVAASHKLVWFMLSNSWRISMEDE